MSAGELATAELLITDCQTTGPAPESGHLLEAAWARARAADPADQVEVCSALALLPDGEVIPNRISRLTGVTMEMMAGAKAPGALWEELQAAAGELRCLAHFAVFEERFYRRLHETYGAASAFPLHFICTHRIAARLLPDLPRRGIRALAGYFGHPLEELKRAGEHVKATLFIWRQLVGLLTGEGVATFKQLEQFLARPRPKRGKHFLTPLPRDVRLDLPDSPGVYRFVNAAGKVVYVGKATSLRSRVNSYYRKRKKADKELEIVSQAVRIETEATGTSLEAALLEAAEIKRLDPLYNTALRNAGRAFGPASDVAALAAEAGYALGRPCPVTDITAAGNWFRLVGGLAEGDIPEAVAEETWNTLRLQQHEACDRALFAEGAALFLEMHGMERRASLARALSRLGRDLWFEMRDLQRQEREARAAGEIDEEDPEKPEEGDEAEEPEGEEDVEITPEIVAGRLTGLAMSVGHQLRRGRWLALLAGAEVVWAHRGGGSRRSVSLPAEPPDTLMQYDLLRVLTTELRRLIRDGRNPEVRLKRRRRLTGDRLARILELV